MRLKGVCYDRTLFDFGEGYDDWKEGLDGVSDGSVVS